jgi:hypothetical protein
MLVATALPFDLAQCASIMLILTIR